MKYKKFIAWFAVLALYVGFLYLFQTPREGMSYITQGDGVSGEGVANPSIGHGFTAEIIRAPRPYFFGLVRLPAYVLGMNIDSVNHLVLEWIMSISLVALIGLELWQRRKTKTKSESIMIVDEDTGERLLV